MEDLRWRVQDNNATLEGAVNTISQTVNNLLVVIEDLQNRIEECCDGGEASEECNIAGAMKYAYYSSNGLYGHEYALLNGKLTTVYLNDDGSLCAPYRLSDGGDRQTKGAGIMDTMTGRPNPGNIASGLVTGTTPGQILPLDGAPPTYGLLTTPTPLSANELQFAILQKSETLTGSGVNALEGWGIRGTNATKLQRVSFPSPPTPVYTGEGLRYFDAITFLGSMNVGGNTTVCTSLQAVTDNFFEYVKGFDAENNEIYEGSVAVRHTFELQRTNSEVDARRVYVTVFVRAITAIGGTMRYCRVVDPNPNYSNGLVSTSFGSLVDGSFALTGSGVSHMGLGGLEAGTILGVASASLGESALLRRGLDGLSKYVELFPANAAKIKQRTANSGDYDTSNDTVLYSTSNYIGDLTFRDQVKTELGITTAGDRCLILISPEMIPDNDTFEFFYDAGYIV